MTSELNKGSKFSFSFTVGDYVMRKTESRSGTPKREKEELPPIEEQPDGNDEKGSS